MARGECGSDARLRAEGTAAQRPRPAARDRSGVAEAGRGGCRLHVDPGRPARAQRAAAGRARVRPGELSGGDLGHLPPGERAPPRSGGAANAPRSDGGTGARVPVGLALMQVTARIATLELAETFTIARSSQDSADVVWVELEHDGVTGYGEAAP